MSSDETQAWGVCGSTDQVGRRGAGAALPRGPRRAVVRVDAARVDRVVSVSLTAPRAAPTRATLPMLRPPGSFQHDLRRAADRATTPTSSSNKCIIDWTGSGYISPLLQRIEGGFRRRALAATCGRDVSVDDQSNDIMSVIF